MKNLKINFSPPLHRILREEYGFCRFVSSPSKQDKEHYLKACKLTNRHDLPFTPSVPVIYERSLSKVTSFIIEGSVSYTQSGLSLGYKYDFYKIRYLGYSGSNEIKVYCEQVTRQELLRTLRSFKFLVEEEA